MEEFTTLHLEMPDLGLTLPLSRVSGRESIGSTFEFELVTVTSDVTDADALLGAAAQLVFVRRDEEVRRMGGCIVQVDDLFESEAAEETLRLRFVPRVWRWSMHETNEIYLDQTVPEIVKSRLVALGLEENKDFVFRLADVYETREFTVQYKESDLAFVSRLCEHVGMSFFFEHVEGRDVIVFTDQLVGFSAARDDEQILVPFRSRGERSDIYALSASTKIIPNHFVVTDYNYRQPQLDLLADATLPVGEATDVYEYGAHYKTKEEGKRIAKVRSEERLATRRVYDVESDSALLRAGSHLTIEGHPRGEISLLVTELIHEAQQTVGLAGKADARPYRNTAKAIRKGVPFRPARKTPKPRVHGVITGVVDAESTSTFAELDSEGRYKVKFLFDTAETPDGRASRPVRMAQPHAGPGYGMHFPLRAGVEVALVCVDGDPDRPIIAGTVPNPLTQGPVTSTNKERNVIRTGGGNEINIDDTADSHRIKLTTPHMGTSFQLGAPNDPESGAMLSTFGASSTVATGGIAALTSMNTSITLLKSLKTAGDITTIAERPDKKTKALAIANAIDTIAGMASGIIDMTRAGMAARVKKYEGDAKIAQLKAEKSQSKVDAAQAQLDTNAKAIEASLPTPPASPPSTQAVLVQAWKDYKAAEAQLATDQTAEDTAVTDKEAVERKNKDKALDGTVALKQVALAEAHAKVVADELDVATKKAAYEAALLAAKNDPTTTAAQKANIAAMETAATDKAAAQTTAATDKADAKKKAKEFADESYDAENSDHVSNMVIAKTAIDTARTGYALFSVVMGLVSLIKTTAEQLKSVVNWVDAGKSIEGTRPDVTYTGGYKTTDVPLDFGATPLDSKYNLPTTHTLGSAEATTLYADKKLLVWSPEVTIFAEKSPIPPGDPTKTPPIPPGPLTGGRLVMTATEKLVMGSEDMAELRSKTQLFLASAKVDLIATDVFKVESKNDTTIESKDAKVGVTAKTTVDLTAGTTATFEAKDELTLKSKKVTVNTAPTDCDAIAVKGKSVEIDAGASGKIVLKAGGFELTMDSNGISMAKAGALKSPGVIVAADHVIMKQGPAVFVKAEGGGVKIQGKLDNMVFKSG